MLFRSSVDSAAGWLDRDGHDRYRYVTLGFGSGRVSRLATLSDAGSVDGVWNSGRTLPELTQHGGAELTNSKFFGKQALTHYEPSSTTPIITD